MKIILTIILLLLSPLTTSSAQKPEWQSIEEILSKVTEVDNLVYLIPATQRCSALSLFMSTILEDVNEELSNSFDVFYETHFDYSIQLSIAYDTQNTGDADMGKITSQTMAAIHLMVVGYTNWANQNYIGTGENTGDPEFQEEISTCTAILNSYQASQ